MVAADTTSTPPTLVSSLYPSEADQHGPLISYCLIHRLHWSII